MNNILVIQSRFRSKRGMALVLVLSILVLVTILSVSFLGRSSVERNTAAAYFEGNRCLILADMAVHLVQAQISHATTRRFNNRSTAWASQPGMIRTFAPNGDLMEAYKLYSDSNLVENVVDLNAAVEKLSAWRASPAHFVDLNAPMFLDGGTTPIFPIIDPSVLRQDGTSEIEGFSVTSAPGATQEHPIPMPVKWLYVLRDGSIVAPEGDGSTATIPGASVDNPITGRIAFWTDDETSKLNINTASHGYFWDIPRAFTLEERDRMAKRQPAFREFQRYPGHPATTSLWPVFGHKFQDRDSFANFIYGEEDNPNEPGITPRVQQGGSRGGTRIAPERTPPGLQLDNARLYSSVDELLFKPSRELQNGLELLDVEKSRFFLTARSNAPEINLFNLPRMAIWPINTGSKRPGALDELIAFSSTINSAPYYLTRENPSSSSHDVNTRNFNLYNYITHFLSVPFPGFGNTTFVQKYTAPECNQITTMIFDYIRATNLYGGVFGATAYTEGNLANAGSRVGQVVPLRINQTKGVGRIPVLTRAVFQMFVSGAESSNAGLFVPSFTGATPAYTDAGSPAYTDFRNFLDITGTDDPVTLLTSAIIYFDTFDPMYGYIAARYNFDIDVEISGQWLVNGVPLGFPAESTLAIRRDHASLYNATSNTNRPIWYGRNLGGLLGPVWIMQNYGSLRGNPAVGNFSPYPLVSNRVAIHQSFQMIDDGTGRATLPPNNVINDTVTFSGGTVTARIRLGTEVIQTYVFDFPATSKPAPVYADGSIRPRYNPSNPMIDPIRQFPISADFRHRWTRTMRDHYFYSQGTGYSADTRLVQDGDVTLSLEPAFGDKRLLAGRSNLQSGTYPPDQGTSFVPHEDYFDLTNRTAVDLRTDSFGWDQRLMIPGTRRLKAGRILNLAYGQNSMPDIPSRYHNGVVTLNPDRSEADFPPDFDNGTLHMADDAYVNRADEGSSFDNTDTVTRYYAWFNLDTAPGLSKTEPTFYSPNKQIPSAVKFGSLPTGVVRNLPWQTLLFRPDPGNHPGAASPPDFLLLDLFWMPVVEPYAISEPFSSNGKVNMNFQIMPFGYIERATAIYGVLVSQELISIPNTDAGIGPVSTGGYAENDEYKKTTTSADDSGYSSRRYRRTLNINGAGGGTLQGFRDLFAANKLFITETQICSLPLIPEDASYTQNFETSYWDSRRLTGDNSREMPYSHLLPRLTTRSNTYTVHYIVQSLKKPPSSLPHNVWNEEQDIVTAESRGSRTIERYIDPNDKRIPDYASATQQELFLLPSLDQFYRWRTLQNREFLR